MSVTTVVSATAVVACKGESLHQGRVRIRANGEPTAMFHIFLIFRLETTLAKALTLSVLPVYSNPLITLTSVG